ncbi:hypothetical protein [Spirillospora sp. NPDC029432]|uniref:hypothetical protein n=1 Tax=Spirillospora sp. NPDC029432 TaxID=3154599 RepID=UPI0034545637
MAHQGDSGRPDREDAAHQEAAASGEAGYAQVGGRLTKEFANVHAADTVARCVEAARHGAEEVTGAASPDLVERIARKHLQVLAVVAAERRRQGSRPTLGNAP